MKRLFFCLACALSLNLNFAHSEGQGFKVLSLDKGSVFEKVGIKAGDTVKSVNQKPVNSPSDAMVIANLIGGHEGKIEVEVVRDGAPKKLIYNLK